MQRWAKLSLCAMIALASCTGEGDVLTVFAAASMEAPISKALALYGEPVRVNYGPSSSLARQIEAGATVDLFISAHPQWTRRISAGDSWTARPFQSNRLVLIGFSIEPNEAASDLLSRLREEDRLCIADPSHVPAGMYAQDVLNAIATRASPVPLRDAPAVVQAVKAGVCNLGIGYASDATASDIPHAFFDAELHRPIEYALVYRPRANDLASFLESPEVQAIFRGHHFPVAQ